MIDKKELISTYLQQFGSHYQISRLLNPTLRIDDEFISHFFEQVVDQYGETFAITEEEKTEIERKIKSQYCIFQDEGAALVGDYEHDFMWYANLQAQEDYDEYYWPRYKAHLENKNFSPAGIDTLENKTLPKLMSYIGNPNEDSPFSIRGLVVGDVQSGKTSNYLGLITKAADAGYKVIFLLTGTIESLRRQTQKRVEEGFIGYDSVNAEDVGVGRGSRTPKAFTSRNNDFTGKNDQNTTYKINDNASEPMIFVIKKNVSVLKKLYASLKNINTSSAVSQITVPMIMIDDEADNASINTNKKDEDPTKINNYIRKILTLFARNTYVGFTATPFANVFISYDTQDEMLADDLFPRHFIYSLESPSNYCGAQKYFFESNSNVRFINDYDDKVFPLRHKKEWDGDKLFPSFYHSINVFLLANAIRDIREVEKNTHRSMLINMSRFTDVQFVIKEIVENYFADMKRAIKQNCRCKKEDYMRNSLISALYESYELEYADNNWFGKTATWDQVFERLPDAIKDIEIAVVNSSRNSNKLDYSKHERDGLRVIAIGGLALSRGLTLEGLCVSYFYRNTATFDVLMQMGRWFGYRDDYGDMCKIYLTDFSYRYYREISQSIDQLKKDIRTMGAQGKRPEDYGIRVRNNSSEMGITAANKMRNTKAKIDRKSFYGSVFETPYLHRSLSAVSENIDHTSAFLRELTVAQKDDLEAQIDGTTYDDYFLTDTLGKLVAMGELIDPQPLCVNKKGRNNRIMSFDALAFDESDKSVVLISNEFKDSVLERNKYNAVSCTFSQEFISDLIPLSIIEDKIKAEMKSEKLGKELNVEGEIVNLGGAYWRNLIAEGLRRKILSPMEIDLLNIAASIDTPRPRIASPKQAKLIWKIRKKLEDSGVLV